MYYKKKINVYLCVHVCLCICVCECVCHVCVHACVHVCLCMLGVFYPDKVMQNTFKVCYNVPTETANGFIGIVHYKNKT